MAEFAYMHYYLEEKATNYKIYMRSEG